MGPFILRDILNVEWYLTMLGEEIWRVISTLENIEDFIFMLDGATPHFPIVVREWLKAHFTGRWIVHDLTPCDFFFGVG